MLLAIDIGQGSRKTHIDQVRQDQPGLDIKDVTRAGNNREVWRELIRNLYLPSQQQQSNHDDDDDDDEDDDDDDDDDDDGDDDFDDDDDDAVG